MSESRRSEPQGHASPARQPSPKRKFVVIDGVEAVPPSERPPPPPIRVVGDEPGDRLTTEELRRRFASNLDALLSLVGLTRKEAADEIGIAYPTLRRLVSAGVSRTDDRGGGDLDRIARYFSLPGVSELWRADLVPTVLHPVMGRLFIAKFRSRLLGVRERLRREAGVPKTDELALLSRALGFESPPTGGLAGPAAEKVAAILASPKGAVFLQIIEDYHDLVRRQEPARDERAGG